mgnify:CR=1 FL=1
MQGRRIRDRIALNRPPGGGFSKVGDGMMDMRIIQHPERYRCTCGGALERVQ